jgi:hypothetical protein
MVGARAYAKMRNLSISLIGQGPSSVGGANYLNAFDLIQGGLYIDPDGSVPVSPIVENKGAGSVHAPRRLWLAPPPGVDLDKLVEEYDWFGSAYSDSSEIACLSAKSQAYIDAVRTLSSNNCQMKRVVNDAVIVTRRLVQRFAQQDIGFWLPGRQPITFPPWIYTPLHRTLYTRDARFSVDFNDEDMLRIGPPRR